MPESELVLLFKDFLLNTDFLCDSCDHESCKNWRKGLALVGAAEAVADAYIDHRDSVGSPEGNAFRLNKLDKAGWEYRRLVEPERVARGYYYEFKENG